ncbi:hypothetical protein QOT17_021231 [Balamuthia mandrillaris]
MATTHFGIQPWFEEDPRRYWIVGGILLFIVIILLILALAIGLGVMNQPCFFFLVLLADHLLTNVCLFLLVGWPFGLTRNGIVTGCVNTYGNAVRVWWIISVNKKKI